MKGHLTVVQLNKYGGIEETLGYPYLSIEDDVVTISCASDSIEHLYETSYPITMCSFKMKAKIPEDLLPNLYANFNKGFGSNFAYNYASYTVFKSNAKKYFEYLDSVIVK